MTRTISFNYLVDHEICHDEIDKFMNIFEEEISENECVEVSKENCMKYSDKFDWECASRSLLIFKQRDVFDSLIVKAKDVYIELTDNEFDEYSAIERPAFEEHMVPINNMWSNYYNGDLTLWNKVLKGDIIWEEYDAILKKDQDIIKECEIEARKKYNDIKIPAHNIFLKNTAIAKSILDTAMASAFAIAFNS